MADTNSIFLIFLKNICLSLEFPKNIATVLNHIQVVSAIVIQVVKIHRLDNPSTRLSIELKKTSTFAFARFVNTPFIKNFHFE